MPHGFCVLVQKAGQKRWGGQGQVLGGVVVFCGASRRRAARALQPVAHGFHNHHPRQVFFFCRLFLYIMGSCMQIFSLGRVMVLVFKKSGVKWRPSWPKTHWHNQELTTNKTPIDSTSRGCSIQKLVSWTWLYQYLAILESRTPPHCVKAAPLSMVDTYRMCTH